MSTAARIGTIVVVGANIAGASAVETVRREGYDGRLVLVGAEPDLPYERPPLSKDVLLGTMPPEHAYLRDAAFYREQHVELRLGTPAIALDAVARRVRLDGGDELPFDRLLIASGGEARRLSVPGGDLAGISYLRTLPEARALAAQLSAVASSGGRVAIVGAGFIGCEVAAACRALGIDVTLIEALAAPMERVLGDEMGARLASVHRAHGVDLRLGEGVAAFHGVDRVEAVETTGGARIACAAAVVGIGVRPAIDWLEGSGVALGDGVLADAFCETTASGIFAAGDVANWPYTPPGGGNTERVRLEHWDNALRQGEAAARNLLGRHVPFTPVPYFWSDQYDLKLQYVGYARTWDALVYRGDPAAGGPYAAFYLAEGQIRAALAVNRTHDLVPLKKLIGKRLDPALLADESTELRALAR